MYLHISSSLSLSNHPWISQNENCILVNSSLPLIRACWHPLISPFWSPQHKYGFQVNIWQALLLNTYWFCGGSVYHRGGGGQSTTIVFWPGGHFTMGVKILSHTGTQVQRAVGGPSPRSAVLTQCGQGSNGNRVTANKNTHVCHWSVIPGI